MYIKKLYATFGCLENKTLTLSPGLNIITAPNESGKSTWSAFIRAMFFGISTREKARSGHLPDKERYRPWSGSAMYGKMELCKDGEDIGIERTSRTDIFSKEEARKLLTGEAVETGEALVGVSRSVYERTAFIGQAMLHIDGDRDTERLILSAASGAEEGASAEEVVSRLEKRRRALRSPRGLGAISELEREIERLERGYLSEELVSLRDEWRTLSLEASRVETELSYSRLHCNDAEKRVSSFPAFEGMSDSGARNAVEKDIERLKTATRKRFPVFPCISLVLAAVCAYLAVKFGKVLAIPAILLAVCGFAAAVFAAISHGRSRRRIEREMIERYGSATPGDIEAALEAYADAFLKLEEAEANAARLKKAVKSAKIAADLKESEFKAAESRAAKETEVRLSDAKERLKVLTLEAEACELAEKVMQEANTELRSRFSPELERRAAELFSELTAGEFEKVRIKNSDFDMDVAKGEASAPRSSLFLSQGTADELYLALRLALCEAILGKEDAPPLILDDALVNFDDARMARALELLKSMAKSRQIIIFSCHSREAKYFENDESVNTTEL